MKEDLKLFLKMWHSEPQDPDPNILETLDPDPYITKTNLQLRRKRIFILSVPLNQMLKSNNQMFKSINLPSTVVQVQVAAASAWLADLLRERKDAGGCWVP
jgi:hypothetical protein